MSNQAKLWMKAAFLGAALLLAGSAEAATVPTSLLADGVLTAQGGGPVADGNYAVVFRIYKDAQGGTPVWEEGPLQVAVKNGVFSQALGVSKPLDAGVAAQGSWITLAVGGDPEMGRKAWRSVPFALRAGVAEGLECTGCVPVSSLVFDQDVALGEKSLSAKVITASFLVGDGSKLTGVLVGGQVCPVGSALVGVEISGAAKCVATPTVWTAKKDGLPNGGFLEIATGVSDGTVAVTGWVGNKDGSWTLVGPAATAAPFCAACGTGDQGDFVASADMTLASGTYNFANFTISPTATLTVVGTSPLVLNVSSTARIAGKLNLAGLPGSAMGSKGADGGAGGGGGGFAGGASLLGSAKPGSGPGPGGPGESPTAGNYSQQCPGATGASGGGGGHATQGSAGASQQSLAGGVGGASINDANLSQGLLGGSGGGAAGSVVGPQPMTPWACYYSAAGGSGGGGGGAVKITAAKIIVPAGGAIVADGGGPGSLLYPSQIMAGCGGGGAGGTIWLQGGQVALAGTVSAVGGNSKGCAAGSAGRIRVDGQVAGISSPVWVVGSAPLEAQAGTSGMVLSQPKAGVVRLANYSGVPQDVRLIAVH